MRKTSASELPSLKENSNRTTFHEIHRCEVCKNEDLISVFNLGLHPLCDDLVPVGDMRICREYPIEILLCDRCYTAHQRFQVPKRELFPASYHYRARFTVDVLAGMAALVDSCELRFGGLSGKKVIDIGCNDGSLLDVFRAKGAVTLGVEPTDAYCDAEQKGHPTFNDYLSTALADKIVAAHGQPDFITFTNVFAHIDNLGGVIASVKRMTGDQTVIVVENHYLGAVLDRYQFDTFYHEHCRTYSCTSFFHIADALGVQLLDVEFPARYGGNIRVFLGNTGRTGADKSWRDDSRLREEQLPAKFTQLRHGVERWREATTRFIEEQVRTFGRLPAKAFPARAAILMKLLGLDENSLSAVYEKPGSLKIGNYVPGTRVPILSDEELFAPPQQTRPILNLAWHIPNEIRSYMAEHGYRGPIVDILTADKFTSGRYE